MSVTVLLPVYNGAATLRQAIDSILAQDDPDFELLVIDDASSDGSPAIVDEYAARDTRVTAIVHSKNVGLASTLNEGLEVARNDLVARMDQDDESLPPRLGAQKDFMAKNPGVVAAGSFVLHMGAEPRFDRLVELPQTPREIATTLQRENCLYHPSVVMRRETVLSAGGYRGEFQNAEDYELWLRLARDHDLANVPKALLRYRFSVNGMTLGRKWEQLFYIHLAQAAARNPSLSLEELREIADASLAEVRRRWFMAQVAEGTMAELARLRLWHDALSVSSRFLGEVGLMTTAVLLKQLGHDYGRAWSTR